MVACLTAATAQGAILRVDHEATGTPINGNSWPQAYRDLSSALNVALAGDQIWVANGTYTPTTQYGGGGSRSVTFLIDKTIKVYGGFEGVSRSGGGETDVALRDPVANPTILSGEIGTGSPTDNAWHVVRFEYPVNVGTQLDGFIITSGYADFDDPFGGAGILVDSVPVVISNCVVRNCFTDHRGAGVLVRGLLIGDPSPNFVNVTFEDNEAAGDGGAVAMVPEPSAPIQASFVNCVFARNIAGGNGGAIWNARDNPFGPETFGGNLTVINCTVVDNEATVGGGVYSRTGGDLQTTIANSILWKNRTQGRIAHRGRSGTGHQPGRLRRHDLGDLLVRPEPQRVRFGDPSQHR